MYAGDGTVSAEVLDGVLDYPMWFPLVAAFQTTSGNLSALAETFTASQSSYKNGQMMSGSFLENHDQPRFQNSVHDTAVGTINSVRRHCVDSSFLDS